MRVTKEDHLVSVIVPIYNVSKYLRTCLDSIITQSYPYLEIVCINDGSTDDSLDIIEEYRKKDNRIVVFSQENKGLSAARNRGIDISTGNYITFVDADDFIEVNMVEVLLKNLLTYNTDIAIESVWEFDENTQQKRSNEESYFSMSWLDQTYLNRAFTYNDIIDKFFYMPVMAWAKMYRADFLKQSGVRFPEGLIYEDNPFFFELFLKASGISVDKRQLYNYRVNVPNSIMNKPSNHFADMIIIMRLIENILKKYSCYDNLKDKFLVYRLIHTLKTIQTVHPKYEKKYFYMLQQEILNIDMLYYNEVELAQTPVYPIYCSIRNDFYWQYKLKKLLKKF